jgi:hypothetical protein
MSHPEFSVIGRFEMLSFLGNGGTPHIYEHLTALNNKG